MPVITIKGFEYEYEKREGTNCKSYIAVFERRCPKCGNYTVCEAENTGYGVIYYAICEYCKTLYVWNTRTAWENNIICE